MVSSFSLAEFGANVDKIHKKACLILLEAECFKLEQGKKAPKTTFGRRSYPDFCMDVQKAKPCGRKTHTDAHTHIHNPSRIKLEPKELEI